MVFGIIGDYIANGIGNRYTVEQGMDVSIIK